MSNTTFSHFFFIIISYVRRFLCCSTMTILLVLVINIRFRLIIICIISSTIIIGWIWLFTRFPITLRFPFTKLLCLWKFYISSNCWKILLFSGLMQIISMSSYSTGNFLPCWVIFLEEYDALLNSYFLLSL